MPAPCCSLIERSSIIGQIGDQTCRRKTSNLLALRPAARPGPGLLTIVKCIDKVPVSPVICQERQKGPLFSGLGLGTGA
uniref:Uncharacterized protein n=1 Tax=Thermogemmatispora argillosa TaxID=2045280 RepID=A0A455T6A3_9CHLR|nr:hypothetical protein KTA_25040 [Thermogemmatispora argillosa]